MENRVLPYCCTGEIFGKMGESAAAQGPMTTPNLEELKEEIRELRRTKRDQGYAFVMCTVNDQQPQAIQMLEDLHFQSSDWMTKTYHPETRVKIFWYPLANLKPAPSTNPYTWAQTVVTPI